MDALREKLHEVGLRATRSRLEVLRVLHEAGGHRSADQIFEMLQSQGLAIPRGSVFKVVADLCSSGILMVTDVGPGRTLYEFADEWHHHFVCRRCGVIMDVPCVVGEKPCLVPEEAIPARIEEAQIIFRGLCHGCLRA